MSKILHSSGANGPGSPHCSPMLDRGTLHVVVLDGYAGSWFVVISSMVAIMAPGTRRRNVGLEDQQQRSERGTPGAEVLLAVVEVVGRMVGLIRIGYEA